MAQSRRSTRQGVDRCKPNSVRKPVRDGKGTRQQRRYEEVDDTALAMSRRNDYSWYSTFPNFAKDAGTLAFSHVLGARIMMTNGDGIYVPGVMAIHFASTPGYSVDNNSPLNRQAIKFQTYLRNVMKAASNYDAADTMMYCLALDAAYQYHSLMRRAYGVASLFSAVNQYYPRNLLQMMGFDPSIAHNLANFRKYINRYALQLAAYPLPASFDIAQRHRWMCEGLYLDSNTTRAQTYMFVPTGFWIYDNTVATGSQLNWKAWTDPGAGNILHTYDEVVQFGDELLAAFRGDQDMTDIGGDMLSLFGEEGVLKVVETTDDYAILPVYSETVLSQIENACIVGGWAPDYTPVIKQDPSVNNGAIIFNPTFKGTQVETPGLGYVNALFTHAGQLINMHWDSPTPEQVMEATRLVVAMDQNVTPGTTNGDFTPPLFGSDVVMQVRIGVLQGAKLSQVVVYSNGLAEPTTKQGIISTMYLMSMFQCFDWAPMLYCYDYTQEGGLDIFAVAADLDNVTLVTAEQLSGLEEAAMLSLFDIKTQPRRY